MSWLPNVLRKPSPPSPPPHRDAVAPESRPRLRPRKPDLPFSPEMPRLWWKGSVLGTSMSNALNLLFPVGERVFIRSVRHYMDRVADPLLRDQVRGFIGQEVRHAAEHERLFQILEAQGYRVETFLGAYAKIVKHLEEALTPELRLAVTVALEHYTAMFAERAFCHDFLDDAPAEVRHLLLWHAAEELEHKCVAFDVLELVDPRYSTRMAGMAVATAGLVGFWIAGTIMFLAQEPEASLPRVLHEVRVAIREKRLFQGDMPRAFRDYLRRDFHPAQNDNFDLARRYIAATNLPAAGSASESDPSVTRS